MGWVTLEITQRCNLDCTLCYLSENSEAVKHGATLIAYINRYAPSKIQFAPVAA